MDPIGLMNKCLLLSNSAINSSIHLYNTPEAKDYFEIQNKLYNVLKEVYPENSISLFLHMEKTILYFDLEKRSNSLEEINSNKAAICQIESAIKALGLVLDQQAYKKLSLGFPDKQKKNGIPEDVVCSFIQSHIARINNKLSAPLSIPEKNVLRQRKENIKKAKELYNQLQREALGINFEKKRGMER